MSGLTVASQPTGLLSEDTAVDDRHAHRGRATREVPGGLGTNRLRAPLVGELRVVRRVERMDRIIGLGVEDVGSGVVGGERTVPPALLHLNSDRVGERERLGALGAGRLMCADLVGVRGT